MIKSLPWCVIGVVLATSAFAQQRGKQTQEKEPTAQEKALQEMVDRALQDMDQEQPQDPPPPVQATRPARKPATPTDLNLTGADVSISVVGDTLVITGNPQDQATINALIQQLDDEGEAKQLQVVKLENRPAADVATAMQAIVDKLFPSRGRPEQEINITAVSSQLVVIVAPGSKMDQLVSIVQQIDSMEPGFKSDFMTFTLKNRKANEAKAKLDEIIKELQRIGSVPPGEEMLVMANDADNSLMVFGPTSMEEHLRKIIEQIDAESVPGFGELKLAVFPLLNAKATELAEMFRDLVAASETAEGATETIRRLIMLRKLPDGEVVELPPLDLERTLRFIPDEGTNSLIVSTIEENIEPIGEIIRLLDDVPISVDMGLRFFPLEFADAQSVTEAIKTLFEEGSSLPQPAPGGESSTAVPTTPEGEALVYNISVIPDLRTNTVFIAGRPVQLSIAERVIEQMDKPATALKFPLKLMFLGENVDATRVGGIVESLFAKRIEALEAQNVSGSAIEREKLFLAVDVRSNALILSASDENYTEIESIVSQLNTARDRLIDNIRLLTCKKTSAADLQTKINELWERRANLQEEGEIAADPPVIVADQRSNSLVIASSPEDYEEIKSLVERLEAQPLAPIAAIRLLVLQNNDASEIGTMLEDLFTKRLEQRLAQGQDENPSDRVAIAVDVPTNTLLVASSPDNFDEITGIVAALDIEPDLEGVVQTFILENAEAAAVAEKIQELFEQGLYNPTVGLNNDLATERMKIAIVAYARANAVIASASKTNLTIIEKLIEQMDAEDMPLRENTRLFQLQYADAVKLTDMLERLFEGMKSNASEPDVFMEPVIIPDDRSNMLIVSGSRDGLKRAEDLIKQLDTPAGPPTSAFEVYPLQHASAARMAVIMQDMFDKRSEGLEEERTPISLFADEGTNALVVSAARDDQLIVSSLLQILDKPSSIARQFQIFPLKRAKAEPLAERLEQLFQPPGDTANSMRADAIAVEPDARTNSLIVWASPTQMENIEEILSRLDQTNPAMEMGIRVIQLKQALAEDLATVLESSLVGENPGITDDSKAVIVSYSVQMDDGSIEQRKLLRQDLTITPDARTNTLTVMAPADSIDMLEALIRDFDKIRPQVAELRLFPLVNADATEVVEKLKELFDPEASGSEAEQRLVFGPDGAPMILGGETPGVRQQMRFTADTRTNTVIAAGARVDLDMVEDLMYQLDQQGQDDRIQLVYTARNNPATDIATAVKEFAEEEKSRLSDLEDATSAMRRAERHVTVVSDEQSNSMVMGVSPRYYDQYMNMVHELDRQPPQVQIQVLIAEVTLDNAASLGIEFAGQDLHFTENAVAGPNGTVQGKDFDFVGGVDVGAAGGTLGGFNFTVTGEDFSFLLRALESDSRLEVLSRPTLLVENNETGNITIGDRVPIPSGTGFSDAGVSSTTVNYEDVGIILEVTPHINPDGFVNLEIHPEISQISDSSIQITEGFTAPIFSERSAETVVTIKDGETVVIGGLITTSERDAETKVPIIGDIPGLGVLFRNTNRTSRKTELLIVLTCNVLRSEDDLREASAKQRDGEESVLLENVKRSPLMGGLRILPKDEALAPQIEKPAAPSVTPNREIYGPTPDVYGPPNPNVPQVETKVTLPAEPVARRYGPPDPKVAALSARPLEHRQPARQPAAIRRSIDEGSVAILEARPVKLAAGRLQVP